MHRLGAALRARCGMQMAISVHTSYMEVESTVPKAWLHVYTQHIQRYKCGGGGGRGG